MIKPSLTQLHQLTKLLAMFQRIPRLFNLKTILILALVLRLVVALLGEHGDVVQYYRWAMDIWHKGPLGFYDRNIDNAVRPTYPPMTSYLFWLTALIHESLWQVFWYLNQHLTIFPGRLIFWLESPKGWYFLNKLPAIFTDLGIIWVLFKFGRKITPEKISYSPILFFAFIPAFWYSSALWGQTDSIYGFFMLAAFYALYVKKITFSAFLYTLAIFTKPTSVFAFPVFAAVWLRSSNFTKTIRTALLCIFFAILLHLPFHPDNFFAWVVMFYSHGLGGELPVLVSNSFNFWALLYGFSDTSETTPFLAVPANLAGYGIFGSILIAMIAYIFKNRRRISFNRVLLFSSLLSFSAFMFLPRMHERYLYPVLILLLPLVGADKKIRNLLLGLSTVYFINLYHYFWMPKVDFLTAAFTNPLVEKLLITGNLILFFLLARYSFQKSPKQ